MVTREQAIDLCECGDYRRDHDGGAGRCRMLNNITHGMQPCRAFRLDRRANAREVAVDACREEAINLGETQPSTPENLTRRENLFGALRLLTRDGKLRERLEGLVEQWRSRVEAGSDAATWFMAADDLEAALKEGEK